MMTNHRDITAVLTGVLLAILAAVMLAGCSTIDSAYDWYRDKRDNKPPVEEPVQPDKPTEPVAPPDVADDIDFNILRWTHGSFDGSKATQSGVVISNLRVNGRSGLTFRYEKNLREWGDFADTDANHALACAFVLADDGSWRGGKFDWISTSRQSRDFKNIMNQNPAKNYYWNFPYSSPTKFAFVIVSTDRRRRSNVLVADWRF